MKGKYEIEIKGQGLGTDLQGWLVPKVIEEALVAALADKANGAIEVHVEGPYDVDFTTAFWTFLPTA